MKPRVAVTYSKKVGGQSVISLKKSFLDVDCDVVDADFREMLSDISDETFQEKYKTSKGRAELFSHAKAFATEFLSHCDCLALSGNSAMIDPVLFGGVRNTESSYDFSRTIMELALVHVATQRGMPIMGVCGGHQVLAVYGGGTVRDMTADELLQQQFMDYNTISINNQSMLHKIIGSRSSLAETNLEEEFFGAHNQVVETPGSIMEITGKDHLTNLTESMESKSGAPVIGTQFHPEVAVHGLPKAQKLYKADSGSLEASEKIFKFFRGAAETYHYKKAMLSGLRKSSELVDQKTPSKEKKLDTQEEALLVDNPQKAKKPKSQKANQF